MRPVSLPLSLLLLIGSSLPAVEEVTVTFPDRTVTGRADSATTTRTAAWLRGHAELLAEPYELRADFIRLHLETEEVYARGSFRLRGPEGEMQGDELEWNLRQRTGSAHQARLLYRDPEGHFPAPSPDDLLSPEEAPPGLLIRADYLGKTEAGFESREAAFTLCDRPQPHYRLTARRLFFQPRPPPDYGRFQARQLRLWLGSHCLGSLNSLTVEGLADYQKLFWLGAGRNAYDGMYLKLRGSLGTLRPWMSRWDGRLGTRSSLTGVGELSRRSGPLEWGLRVSRQEEVPGRLRDRTRISRLSELWASTPLRTLSALSAQWQAQAGWGSFRDHEAQRTTQRQNVRLTLRGRPFQLGNVKGGWEAWYSHSWYGTGDEYNLSGVWLSLSGTIRPRHYLGVTYKTHVERGETALPSLDRPDIRHELQLQADTLIDRNWHLGLEGRYDLPAGKLEQVHYLLARRVHCLEYGLTWRERPSSRVDACFRVLGF